MPIPRSSRSTPPAPKLAGLRASAAREPAGRGMTRASGTRAAPPRASCSLKPRTQRSVALPPIARVVFWMTGTLLSFSAMAVSIRELSATLSIMEILSVRSAAGLLIVGALLAAAPAAAARPRRSRRLRLHVLRNSIHFGAQYLWATSLLLLPLEHGVRARVHHAGLDHAAGEPAPRRAHDQKPHRRGRARPPRRAGDPAARDSRLSIRPPCSCWRRRSATRCRTSPPRS